LQPDQGLIKLGWPGLAEATLSPALAEATLSPALAKAAVAFGER
jgi:hypothetical protein